MQNIISDAFYHCIKYDIMYLNILCFYLCLDILLVNSLVVVVIKNNYSFIIGAATVGVAGVRKFCF